MKKSHLFIALAVAVIACAEPADAAVSRSTDTGATTSQIIEAVAHTGEFICISAKSYGDARRSGDTETEATFERLSNAHAEHLVAMYGEQKTGEIIAAADHLLKAKRNHNDGKIRDASCESWKNYLLSNLRRKS